MRDDDRSRISRRFLLLFVVCGLGLLGYFALPGNGVAWLKNLVSRNEVMAAASRVLIAGDDPAIVEAASAPAAGTACTFYAAGLIAYEKGDLANAESNWADALALDGRYLRIISILEPDNLLLAGIAAQNYPGDATGWKWLGDAQIDDPAAALESYTRSAELYPYDFWIWIKIGTQAEMVGEPGRAIDAYRTACDINPIANSSCLNTARLSYERGDYQTVIDYYEKGGWPEHPDGWVRLVRAARALGLDSEADRYLAQARQENPADYDTLLQEEP